MIRIFQYLFLILILLQSAKGLSQNGNSVALHLQVYDEGICLPMLPSNFYSTSRYQKTKSVLQSGSYYSRMCTYLNSLDSTDLKPQSNHKIQASSLQLQSNLDYELVFIRLNGFERTNSDSMVIKISKLAKDAQLIIPFKQGVFRLEKMKFFKNIKANTAPDFSTSENVDIKNTLQLDSIAYYADGKKKANFYMVAANFPIYYVQEFDSVNTSYYAQGYRMISNYNGKKIVTKQAIWADEDYTKYGYWEYFENGKRVKHEYRLSMLLEKFEWYPSGQIRSENYYGDYLKKRKYVQYLDNGNIKEEFYIGSSISHSFIKSYAYSTQGKVILINTYHSSNGITKQGLQKRTLFYQSGKLKMEENFIGTYSIKYYKEDGTERIN